MNLLVRHILLAEPMADDFEHAFAGVGPEEAAEAAGSFAFDQCATRDQLADVLREHLSPVTALNVG